MANLRILDINAADSRTIKVRFSDNLSENITTSNVQITADIVNVPDLIVTGIYVFEDILTINTLPQTPYSRYTVSFISTESFTFSSSDGLKYLIEDGKLNSIKVLGAENDYCPTRDTFIDYLGGQQSIYDLSRESFIRTYLNQISTLIDKTRSDIRQLKNANYLELTIKDERKTRRFGPWDRLNQEGAFEILRVGKTPTNENLEGTVSFTIFPSDPITLQGVTISNEILSSGIGESSYNNDLIFTLKYFPVTKITSIQIQYENGDIYNYNIRYSGYRIYDNKYDTKYGKKLLTLQNNQIKLNDQLKEDPTFVIPGGNDKIIVSYEYKSLGKVIDENSVEVVELINIVRETAPALTTMFSLINAPVITSSDKTPTANGVEFLDPYSSTPFRSIHPAFKYEIPYREGSYPIIAGQYAIDYDTGRVFVYGAIDNDGTGNFPPVMNYYYRKTYNPRLDYTYVPEFKDLVASPLRELIGKPAKINYNYEQVLIPGVDYRSNVHTENKNERIENRLATLDSFYTLNSPITDVFRIYNETTGEIYPLKRFSDNRVYFTYNNPPRIQSTERERVSFTDVLDEQLVLESEYVTTYGVRVLQFNLASSNIINGTEDGIGISYNSSVNFSQTDVFNKEIYYDFNVLSATENIERLSVGQYQINYQDGIVYVGVLGSQLLNVGTISYKSPIINPIYSHITSVSEIYCSLNENYTPSKILNYDSFSEDAIFPTINLLDFSDERYLSKNSENPYVVYNDTITVTDDIKNIRGIYDIYNLNNSTDPVNFAESATFNANIITFDNIGIQQTSQLIVGDGYTITVPFISPGIEIATVISVIRTVDNVQLLDGYQTFTETTITLNSSSGAVIGDTVSVIYTVILNSASTPAIDYNRGDLFINYSYCFDEILVTYEWGDDVIDFRESNILNENDIYYVTYKVGALRNSLLENFGSLIDVDELQNFDEELDREVYRDILQGALQTFTKGPTIQAMTDLIANVTQIDPRIVEAAFWSLGVSYLQKINTEVLGDSYLTVGCFDQGLSINNIGDGVSIPISNNLRLEEGTLEMCLIPGWNGVDNDASLTFELYKDGYYINSSDIYIGASSYNPDIVDGSFVVNRTDNGGMPEGLPALIFTKTGIFIYYDLDNRQWKILAKDEPTTIGIKYSGKITTSGSFYNVQFISGLGDLGDVLRSGIKTVSFEFNLDSADLLSPDGYDGYSSSIISGYSFDGIQFMSDAAHYFFDFGTNENQNRFSLYKDGRGYLVFEVWDKGGFGDFYPERRNVYQVSADIKNWIVGDKHNIGISWVLNSSDRKDEMHLYVDGFETPNLARYGNVPSISTTERFRTIVPEQVVGMVLKKSISGNDLIITQGSNIVTSISNDFTSLGILPGDRLEVLESGFYNYEITSVSGSLITLDSNMPATVSNGRFSINPVEIVVGTEIDIYKNIGVYVYSDGYETEIPGTRADIPSYSIERNTLNQRILKIIGNANVGDTVLIKTFGLNHRRCRDSIYLWSDSYTIKTALPPPINLDDVIIKPIILPLTPIGPSNSSLISGSFVSSLDGYTQTSSSLEGRYLDVRITGDNTNFTTPVTVTITGVSNNGTSETLVFTSPIKQTTLNKWMEIDDINIVVKPIITTKNSSAVEIKETYSITQPAGNNIYPVIRFAYRTQAGLTLEGDGYTLTDSSGFFPVSSVGNLLQVTTPSSAAGLYEVESVINNTSITIDTEITTPFTGGSYELFNISIGRSGFQNGFFFFEQAGFTNTPFELPSGWYEIDYATNLEVPFDPINQIGIIGNDITLQKPAKSIIDEFRILNRQLTDTRIGETISDGEESITTGANKVSVFEKNQDTLTLFHFEETQIINDSDVYKFAQKNYIQSANSINSKFGHSIVIRDKGLIFDNDGRLDTSNEGSIEFWVSPRFDTYNDPVIRVYFDAAANIVEEVTSITKGKITLSRTASSIVYIRLINDTNLTGTEYFNGGIIGSDGKTITLNSPLPYQNTPVRVVYIPSGVQGDRVNICKDSEGFISFTVTAQGKEYQTRQPIFWARDTWHRIRASFKFNRADNQDEIRLFVDGEERGCLMFGAGDFVFGQGTIWGQSAIGAVTNQVYKHDINFTDTVMQFSLGQDYAGCFGAEARFDNIKLSNIAIEPIVVSGQPMDVYYNTNTEYIYPSVEDSYTTFLYNFDQTIEKTEDFSVIRDPVYGIFNFDIDIIDSFGIVTGDERVKVVLEALINALKPATSKVGLKYFG